MKKSSIVFLCLFLFAAVCCCAREQAIYKKLQLGLETFSSEYGTLSHSAFLGLFLDIDWGIRMNSYFERNSGGLPTFEIVKKGVVGGALCYEAGMYNAPGGALPLFAGLSFDVSKRSSFQVSLNCHIFSEFGLFASVRANAGW